MGGVAHWLDHEVLPAMGVDPGREPGAPVERALLTAMSGPPSPDDVPGSPAARVVRWQDWSYRVDLSAVRLARVSRVRKKQGGNTLDQVLELSRLGTDLASASTVKDVTAHLATLRSLPSSLHEPSLTERRGTAGWSVQATLDRVFAELGKVRTEKDLKRARTAAALIVSLSDVLLAEVLRALAYAPCLGDPDGPLLLGGDVSQRHDFGLTVKDHDTRIHAAWSFPESPAGFGLTWQVWGSLLGLDVGLARLALPQVTEAKPPGSASLNEATRKAVVQSLALFNPFMRGDEELSAVAASIERGRRMAAGLIDQPEQLDALSPGLWLSDWKWRLLPWMVRHEPGALSSWFSLGELHRLGQQSGAPPPDGWGAPMLPANGCLCLRMPERLSDHTYQGRPDTGYVAAGFADINLRVAEAVARLGLPASLGQDLLLRVVPDVLDETRAAFPDDLEAASRYVFTYPASRIEAYVSSLTAGGPLVPVSSPQD